jgi:hypothetical protein
MNKPENLAKPQWSDPDLGQEFFLYQRRGPWPQPAPSYPLRNAPEVLNSPSDEAWQWNMSIGVRYLKDSLLYAPHAALLALEDGSSAIPSDAEFVRVMTDSIYARYLRSAEGNSWTADFTAIKLLEGHTLPGTYCAPLICRYTRAADGKFSCVSIDFQHDDAPPRVVKPGEPAWNLAKVYALQCATYQTLFVVHPALHFPMDAVNAITKTAVPQIHPLFQAIYPHSAYQLPLDNAVLEGTASVVNNHVASTWYDPFTAKGIDIMRLFGAGYVGMDENSGVYPGYDYLQPWMDDRLPYGKCLMLYFDVFLKFCTAIAEHILTASPNDTYVARWAQYLHTSVRGFPDEKRIFEPGVLARTLAVYMWDVSVAHGADHYSYVVDVAPGESHPRAVWKFLRVRVAPPAAGAAPEVTTVGDVCDHDDLFRAELAQYLFFTPWGIKPNLNDTTYDFASLALQAASTAFHAGLERASKQALEIMPSFMPLLPPNDDHYAVSLPASIQY